MENKSLQQRKQDILDLGFEIKLNIDKIKLIVMGKTISVSDITIFDAGEILNQFEKALTLYQKNTSFFS